MLYPKTKTLFKLKSIEGSRRWDRTTGEILADTAALHFLPLEDLIFTEKINGCLLSLGIKNRDIGTIGSKSREIVNESDKYYIEMANEIRPKFLAMSGEIIQMLLNTIIYGELCGPKIQKGYLYFDKRRFLVFDIFDCETGKFFTWGAVEYFCKELGLETVPVIDYKTWYEKSYGLSRKLIIDGMPKIPWTTSPPLNPTNIKLYLQQLKSVYNPEYQAEGMVIRYKKDTSSVKRWVAKIRCHDFFKEGKK